MFTNYHSDNEKSEMPVFQNANLPKKIKFYCSESKEYNYFIERFTLSKHISS